MPSHSTIPLPQDTYGTYAELRHKVSGVLASTDGALDATKAADVAAQRDYMDTVCRSYAARLDRRRRLVLTSLRFHRLVNQVRGEWVRAAEWVRAQHSG
jgi:hypothetical protein